MSLQDCCEYSNNFDCWLLFILAPCKAKLLQLKLIHIFARAILLIKKLEIEKTKLTFIISVLKVEYSVDSVKHTVLLKVLFQIFLLVSIKSTVHCKVYQ